MKPGWVWINGKGQWRPFVEWREIRKGRNKGKMEVVLPPMSGRRILVDRSAIKSYPVEAAKEVTE
jgi:hypothetical protein